MQKQSELIGVALNAKLLPIEKRLEALHERTKGEGLVQPSKATKSAGESRRHALGNARNANNAAGHCAPTSAADVDTAAAAVAAACMKVGKAGPAQEDCGAYAVPNRRHERTESRASASKATTAATNDGAASPVRISRLKAGQQAQASAGRKTGCSGKKARPLARARTPRKPSPKKAGSASDKSPHSTAKSDRLVQSPKAAPGAKQRPRLLLQQSFEACANALSQQLLCASGKSAIIVDDVQCDWI